MLHSSEHHDAVLWDVLMGLFCMMNTDIIPPANREVAEGDVLVNSRQLRQMIPVCDMTIRRWEKDPQIGFPRRIKLNGGHVFWKLAAVKLWINRRDQSREAPATPDSFPEEATPELEPPPLPAGTE